MTSRRIVAACLAAGGVAAAPAGLCGSGGEAGAGCPMRDYLEIRDEAFGFNLVERLDVGGVDAHILRLVSQTWRGRDWEHRLALLLPEPARRTPDGALLVLAGGRNRPADLGAPDPEDPRFARYAQLAERAGLLVAVLQQVPNQPLLDGLVEDALIARTFERFLDEGDPDWPLLLPMTKSAVRAMDAVQRYAREAMNLEIGRFVVTGNSKRGWTSYLAAAMDPRVRGVAPVAIDLLNLPLQMERQRMSYGRYSERIHDYTERHLMERLRSEAGQALARIVDPYAYLDRLALPILVILGTNDPYWTVDAANLYFPELPGPRYLHYGPNTGHAMGPAAAPTLLAFLESVLGDRPMPGLRWNLGEDGALDVWWDTAPASVSLWTARAEGRDFREARWRGEPLRIEGNRVLARPAEPETGYLAYFVQAEFPGAAPDSAATLSTPITVRPRAFPFAADGTPRPARAKPDAP